MTAAGPFQRYCSIGADPDGPLSRIEPWPLEEMEPVGVKKTLRHFEYSHLPGHLQAVSRPVCELAYLMADRLPDGPEKTAGLRKLLEAKDAFVRAELERE